MTYLNAILSIAAFGSTSLLAQQVPVSYSFDSGMPAEVSVNNAATSLDEGGLQIKFDEKNRTWRTSLRIELGQPLPETPILRLKYRVSGPTEIANTTLATTLKIDGVYTSAKDKGRWRKYTGLDISDTAWRYHDIPLSPMIASWEGARGTDHGPIEEVNVVFGTGGQPFAAETFILDSITVGELLTVKRVEANPKDLQEVIVYFHEPVAGSAATADFSLNYEGADLPINSVFVRNENRLVVQLQKALKIPGKPEKMPSLILEYRRGHEIHNAQGIALSPFREDVSLSGILGDYIDINPNPELGNPLHLTIFGPDPSAHVWKDGRVYVYPSRDTPDQKNYMGMQSWHVLSSEDLVNWTDHGRIFHVDDIPWVKEKAWAPDAAYKDGTYYFYFPVDDVNGEHWVGVATSKSPTGPFENPVRFARWVDPQIFTDYDGNYWLALNSSIQKIADDMLSVEGEVFSYKDYAVGFPDYPGFAHEGTWVFKRNGLYYLTTAGKSPEPLPEGMSEGMPILYYGIGTSPTGPFEFKGKIMDAVGNPYNPNYLANNHHSIVKVKGQWVLFYHKMWKAPDGAIQRAMCADYITFNPDGTIQEVIPTDTGVDLRNSPTLKDMETVSFEETIH